MMVEIYFANIVKMMLTMTVTGSVIAFFLFAIKPLIKNKLPKSFQYYMWLPVIIALILPLSEMVAAPVSAALPMSVKSAYDTVQGIADRAFENAEKSVSETQDEKGHNLLQTARFPHKATIVFMIWQGGMLLTLGFHMTGYLLFVRRLKKCAVNANRHETAMLKEILAGKNAPRLYKSPVVAAPVLAGVCCPAIILPVKIYEEDHLRCIFMHELTHMKRRDIVVKWLLMIAGALHWFNPILYFVRREMNKACELACDESVIKEFGRDETQRYGNALIAVAADTIRKTPVTATMMENKKNLKERLGAIMKYQKYSRKTVVTAGVILGLMVCGVLGLGSLSGAQKEEEWVANHMDPSRQKNYKAMKLEEAICAYEKQKIVDAYVYLGEEDETIANATALIICREKNPGSEMKSGIQTLVSEQLALDEQDIRIDYLDVETFTSSDGQDIFLD